ncbi:cytochrome c family protein [hydrocarbon metagenome]|uniref:Cytochrome c family protein n=1 Tax=hydrocarbon metagenome TaxID=938273 RepID=A0A0W8FWT1_9ZZZZ
MIKMKKMYLIITVLTLFIVFTAQTGSDEEMKNHFSEISVTFMEDLKSVLMENLIEGGPLQAITVCSDTAQELINIIGKKNNVELKRVTFKPRNPKDTADTFETKVLSRWHDEMNEGKLDNETNYLEIMKIGDETYARYMQPIFIQGPCLTCHGGENMISSEVKDLLKEKYPDDKATGYKPGDLRGAISIKKKL